MNCAKQQSVKHDHIIFAFVAEQRSAADRWVNLEELGYGG
jgi:hypothetical protein